MRRCSANSVPARRSDEWHHVLPDQERAFDAAEMVTPTRKEFIRQLGRIFPYAGPEKLARAVGLVVSTMALAPFDSIYAQEADKPPTQDRQVVLDLAPEFAAAGVTAICGPFVE